MAAIAEEGSTSQIRGSFGLVYDDPDITDERYLRYDACVSLASGTSALLARNPSLRERTIPAGNYARAVHLGPYDDMGPTYIALLGQWLPGRGVELYDEPVVEIYLNSPDDTEPQDLVSEICVRVRG